MKYEMVHTCIRVLDLEKSVEFYKNALGFKEIKRKGVKGDFTLVFMSDGISSHELELTYNYGREEPYEIGNGFSHIAVVVSDLEKSHQGHKEMGYSVTDLKGLPGDPPRYYFVKDPDGYLVEIVRK